MNFFTKNLPIIKKNTKLKQHSTPNKPKKYFENIAKFFKICYPINR